MVTGEQTMNRTIDYTVGGAGVALPVWLNLSQINDILTFISLILGIALMIWRIVRSARRSAGDKLDG